MSDSVVTPERLASALAARLIHDAMGPASGIVSAFDILANPADAAMHDEALVLAARSARSLVDILTLSRTVYGGGGAPLSTAELSDAAGRIFVGSRATLSQHIDPDSPTATSGRVYLGLLQIMASCAASGGEVVAAHGRRGLDGAAVPIDIAITASGPRAAVHNQIHAGFAGGPPGAGLPHRWSAAYLIGAIARSAGGNIQVLEGDGGVSFRASIKADMA